MKIPKETLGLAAEFAVASELCRRNIYAQLTLGLRKRTDLLIETETGMLRVQVKGKQAREWPGCKGISGEGITLIFVDFEDKSATERPDFYILTPEDWEQVIERELRLSGKIDRGDVSVDQENTPTWRNRRVGTFGTLLGREYVGMGIRPKMIEGCKERWDKIITLIDSGAKNSPSTEEV